MEKLTVYVDGTFNTKKKYTHEPSHSPNYKDAKKIRKVKKNTVNKYMADIRPDRLATCQSERKSVVSRRPSVFLIITQVSNYELELS
jgi:hypothetical protein